MIRGEKESPLEEAKRQDVLDEEGALDELPFTALRRYAKEPTQVYSIRLPVSRLEAIRTLADRRDEQPTALLREWVLERLDEEVAHIKGEARVARETTPPYRVKTQPKPRKKSTKTSAANPKKKLHT